MLGLQKAASFLQKASYGFCWLAGKAFFNFLFDFEVRGEENLKNLQGPAIVVFNHTSWLDPFLVDTVIPPKAAIAPVRYAVWYKHYYKFLPLMLLSGAFPVKKGEGLEKTLRPGLEILKTGGTVGIAPEEKRRHFGKPRRPRRGTAFLALTTNSPILPVKIEGLLGLNLGTVIFKKPGILVKIGQPFLLEPKEIKTSEDLNEPANQVMAKIEEL